MPEKVTYYAIVDSYSSRHHPAGVLRRAETDDGRRDEAFGRNLAWGYETSRYSALPGAGGWDGELHEITADEADMIVSRMRLDAAQD